MNCSTNFIQDGFEVILLTHGHTPRADEHICLVQSFQESGLECGRAIEGGMVDVVPHSDMCALT